MDIFVEGLPQLLIMLFLLVLSGLFSGSETAIFSLKRIDLNRLRKRPGRIPQAILTLHANQADFLMTVLFCNMLVNILFFASSTVFSNLIAEKYGSGQSFLFGIICLLAVITFGEVTPKSLATAAQIHFASITAVPMLLLHNLLWPVRRTLGALVHLGERVLGIQPRATHLQAADLQMLVDLSRNEGVISAHEQELISEIIELPEVRIRELMTHRVDLVTVTTETSSQEVIELAREHGHSKIPVRDPQTDELIGWVDARTLFLATDKTSIVPYIQKAMLVSEFDRADTTLARLREQRNPLALVVDEWGATNGMLTLSDIVGTIFGSITDEDGEHSEPIREDGENAYLLNGNVSVREWRSLFAITHELPHTITVGGLVTALLGRNARRGDMVELGNLRMEVRTLHGRRIEEIRVTLQTPPESDGEAHT